jgi:hypothetical protein
VIARHNIRPIFWLLVLIAGIGTAIFFALVGDFMRAMIAGTDFMRAMIAGTVAIAALYLVTLDK